MIVPFVVPVATLRTPEFVITVSVILIPLPVVVEYVVSVAATDSIPVTCPLASSLIALIACTVVPDEPVALPAVFLLDVSSVGV